MAWLIGLLLAVLILLLLYLTLPVADWRNLLGRVKGFVSRWRARRAARETPQARPPAPARRPPDRGTPEDQPARDAAEGRAGRPTAASGPSLWERLASEFKDFVGRIRGEPRREPPAPSRTWEELSLPAEERTSWQERRGRPALKQMSRAADKGRRPAAEREGPQRTPVAEFRLRLVLLFAAVLIVGIVLTLFLRPRLPAPRPPRFTVAFADLDVGEQPDASERGSDASGELLWALQEALATVGLTETVVTLLPVHQVPSDASTAYSLCWSQEADLLVWGEFKEGVSAPYFLTLTVAPRSNHVDGEVADYLQVMMTPRQFPLSGVDRQGLSREDSVQAMSYLVHFYLGKFDRIEGEALAGEPAGTIHCPSPSLAVTRFHCAGLMWLQGDYGQAQGVYRGLASQYTAVVGAAPPPLCAGAASPEVCAASYNNQAVSLLTEEALGDVSASALDEAVDLLRSATQVVTPSVSIQYNLGQAYLAQRDWGQAVEQLAMVVGHSPQHARALAALGEAYRGADDPALAGHYTQLALQANPNLPEARLAMGRYWIGMGDFEKAGEELDKALELAEARGKWRRSQEVALSEAAQPNTRRAAYMAAWARRNDPLLVRAYSSRANRFLLMALTKTEPNFIEFLWQLLAGEPNHLNSAWGELDQALVINDRWYEARYLQGYMYYIQGSYEDAAAAFGWAQEQDPGDPASYLALAQVYRVQGQLEPAKGQYNLLVDGNVAAGKGHLGLGEIAMEEGDRELAVSEFQQAIQAFVSTSAAAETIPAAPGVSETVPANPDLAEAYLQLGLARLSAGDEQGMDDLDQAARRAGTEHWIRLAGRVERGEILLERYLQAKRAGMADGTLLADACEEFEGSQERPQGVGAGFPLEVTGVIIEKAEDRGRDYQRRYLNGLGRIRYEEGRYAEAGGLFQLVLQSYPRDFAALYGRGRVALAQGDSGTALQYFYWAVEVDRFSIAARYYLGAAYYAQMRKDEARVTFQRTLELCEEQKEQPQRRADDLEACEQAPGWLGKLDSDS